MKMKIFFCLFAVLMLFTVVEARENEEAASLTEARGKGKYALLIHFFYVVATKLFVLKLVYGAIFYVIVTKGWHFVLWFIHYLKGKKHHEHHEYIDDHDHYHDHSFYQPDHSQFDHQPYGYGYTDKGYKKRVYDSDGSYSVKGKYRR